MRPKVTPVKTENRKEEKRNAVTMHAQKQWKQRTENRNGVIVDGPHQTIDWNGRNVPKCRPSGVQRSKLIRAVARVYHSIRAVDPSCENYPHCLIFL
ncbi:hypothetical protein RU639_009885 [Aspergillus parasiticus]